MLLRHVVVGGRPVDVRLHGKRITEIAEDLEPGEQEQVIDGGGGACIPGLHDHHVHLAAMAAADRSVRLDTGDLDDTLRRAHDGTPPGDWTRAVGYDEVRHGPLTRHRLDRIAPGRPVRVQHRSGAMWVLSSEALRAVGPLPTTPRVERAADGEATGRVFGLDEWLHARLPRDPPPHVGTTAARMATYGITGVTDATPSRDPRAVDLLVDATAHVDVTAMGGSSLATATFPPEIGRGTVKIVLADQDLPSFDQLTTEVQAAHDAGRGVALHCVTRASLTLAVAAWRAAGARPGDRVEHGAVVPPELRTEIVALGLTVVTQPGFIAHRGDAYLAEVDEVDLPHLYPCRSLLEAAVPVGGSTDAPFGPEDPWLAMRAAVGRRTVTGQVVGEAERVTPERALALFLSSPSDPGGPSRRIDVDAPADLCLLDCDLPTALHDLHAEHVRMTIRAAMITYDRPGHTTPP